MEETNTELWNLRRHLERCKDSYRQEMLRLDKEGVYEKSSEISNLNNMFVEIWFLLEMSIHILDDSDWPRCILGERLSEEDALYLLSLENPLKFLVSRWELYGYFVNSDGDCADFKYFINELRKEWRAGSEKVKKEGETRP